MQEKIEINDKFLEEIFDNNNIKMDLKMLIITNDKTVRSDTMQDLKGFNSQSLATQAKKGDQLVSMMPANKRTFDLTGDDIDNLSTENESSKKMAPKMKNA